MAYVFDILVCKVKDKAQEIYNVISANKAIAEEKLLEAKPALEEAERALKTIQPSHIATVRRLANPPNLIMRIMDAVSLLFKRKMDPVVFDTEKMMIKPSWSESLKLMGGLSFLNDLLNFQRVCATNSLLLRLVTIYSVRTRLRRRQ